MQRKHLIVLTLVTVLLLLGFNILNNQRHEQSRAVEVTNDVSATADANTTIVAENNNSSETSANSSEDIAAKPITEQTLGKQPKAILDKATTEIEQAQNVEQQRLEQMESAQ